MTAATLISRYNHLNGKQISVATLRSFHQDVQRFLDSVGHGPFVSDLKGILSRTSNALKQAAGYEVIDRVELTPIDIHKTNGRILRVASGYEEKKKVEKKIVIEKPANLVAEEIPITKIHTDTKRFQNRQDAFSEASANSVAENYDPNKFDPIVVWMDKKVKKLFVLSGHSRYEGMKRRKSKAIAVRYFKGTESEAIQFAKVEANRGATQETLIEDLAAYRLMRDGDAKRGVKKLNKSELQKIFKGKVQKLEAYSYLAPGGLFVNALSQATTSNYPYLERNAQWIGQLRKENAVLQNSSEDNIFHFFYSDKTGKHLKLSKDEFFKLAKKRINQLAKGEHVLFPECSTDGCVRINEKESDPIKGATYKRLRELNETLESINQKLKSTDPAVRVSTQAERDYLIKELGPKLNAEKEKLQAELNMADKQESLFGIDKCDCYGLERDPEEAKGDEGLGFTKEGQQKIYDMITGMILKVIKENKALPWRKPWKIKSILATNFKTKTVYRGANLYLLNLIAPMFFGKIGPYWMTFKQVKDMGGRVKAGASAFPVIYYSVYYSVNKPTRKTITEEEYNAMTQEQRVQREAKELWTINYYNVFAQEDIEGIEFPALAEKREANPIETAEAIVQGMPQRPDIQHHKVGRAFYAPGEDYIRVPEIGYFASDQEYYSTLFHELVHSTGHPSRLDRFEANKKVAPEGLDYDFEELIAEMGASYLNAEAGILYFTLKNSAAYLKGWQKKLEDAMSDDNKFFLKASAKAAQAADFILNRKETKVAEPPKSARDSKSPRPPVERKERSKAIQERSKKPAAAMAGFSKNLSGVVGADQLAGLTFKEIPLDGEWKSEFNRLMSDTQIMIWGVPGSGKTVKLLKFAQYLAEKGIPTLYVANEEFGRSSFTEKIREFNIGHEQLKFAKYLPEDVSEFQAIFLDSVQSIGMDLDGYKKFRETYPNKLTVAIIQSTKDGDFRGGKDWEHEVDIAGEVISRKLRMRKNRLDPDHESKAEKIEIEHMVNEKTKSQKIKEKVKQKIETQQAA